MYPDKEKELDSIGDHEDVEMETDEEILARYEGVDMGRGFGSHGYQDQVRHIMVYEAYIMLDTEGEGIAKLHRIVKAGNVILDKAGRQETICRLLPTTYPALILRK